MPSDPANPNHRDRSQRPTDSTQAATDASSSSSSSGSSKDASSPGSSKQDARGRARDRRDASAGDEASNGALVWRLLKLSWRFRGRAMVVVALQIVQLSMVLAGLGMLGVGVDVMGTYTPPGSDGPLVNKQPQWPFGLEPPRDWGLGVMEQVLLIAGAVLVVAVLRFGLDFWSRVAVALLTQDIVVTLRSEVYDRLQRLGFSFFDRNESGSLINRVTGDVQGVRMFVNGVMIPVMMTAISLVFFLTYMLSIHVWLTLACLGTLPLLWALTVMFSRTVKPAYRTQRRLFDDAIRVLSENVQGVHVVKGFSRQDLEIEKFRVANDRYRDQQHWIFWRVSTFVPIIGTVTSINLVVLLSYGGYLFFNDPTFSQGEMLVFYGLLSQFSQQVGNIAGIANSVQRSLTSAGRVFEVLDAPIEIVSPPSAVALARAEGRVSFEGVGFSYVEHQDAPTLADLSFEVKPGQTVAILGATGAGKSTLLSLIPRFYDPTAGRVCIDGRDIREYDLDDLRRNIGCVFQESFLFSNSVAENIAFGHPGATREQVEKAATIAQAHGFITRDLAKGYDTVLMENGSNLSGGQRQRLALARAILLEPPILVLDDPTAAIDPETEHEIMSAMNSAMEGRTTFIVAHRLSTLKRADLILVLDHGRIVQRGTHGELLDSEGHYRHVANLQTADETSRRLLGMPA